MDGLTELGFSSVRGSGFILDISQTHVDIESVDKSSTLDIADSQMEFDDMLLYVMNGLYALKEGYRYVTLIVFGSSFTVTLRKNASPDKEDYLKVCEAVMRGVTSKYSIPAIAAEFAKLQIKIQSGELVYEE